MCSKCGGVGIVNGKPCSQCHGSGFRALFARITCRLR